MRTHSCFKAAAVIAVITLGAPATNGHASKMRPLGGPTQISVSFNTTLPALPAGGEPAHAQTEAMRRAFYELLTRECEVLLASIASSCQLTSANVNVHEQRHGHAHPYVQMSGNGQFAIELKSR